MKIALVRFHTETQKWLVKMNQEELPEHKNIITDEVFFEKCLANTTSNREKGTTKYYLAVGYDEVIIAKSRVTLKYKCSPIEGSVVNQD